MALATFCVKCKQYLTYSVDWKVCIFVGVVPSKVNEKIIIPGSILVPLGYKTWMHGTIALKTHLIPSAWKQTHKLFIISFPRRHLYGNLPSLISVSGTGLSYNSLSNICVTGYSTCGSISRYLADKELEHQHSTTHTFLIFLCECGKAVVQWLVHSAASQENRTNSQ